MGIWERSALLFWAAYKRWPLYGFAACILGLVIGGLVYGLIGMALGAVGGLTLGLIAGVALGIDHSMLPVTLELWVKYGGSNPKVGARYPARVSPRSYDQENAPPVEDIKVDYLIGRTLKSISYLGPPVWTHEAGKPVLMVMQTDRFTHLPITWRNGVLSALRVPIYHSEIITDKNTGKESLVYPTFKVSTQEFTDGSRKTTFVKNEKGELIPDAQGQPLKVGEREEVLFDSNIMLEEDKVVKIPVGAAAKMNSERSEYTQTYSLEASRYKMGGWWSKHGNIVVAALSIIAILTIAYFTIGGLTDQANKVRDSNAVLSQKLSDALSEYSHNSYETAKLNAQTADALKRMGYYFSVNVTTTTKTGEQAPPQPAAKLNIPFVTG